MLSMMKGGRILRVRQLLLRVGGIAIGLIFALLDTFRDLFAGAESTKQDRPIQDSDLVGDYNFQTQQFDSGTDPAGWYGEDLEE